MTKDGKRRCKRREGRGKRNAKGKLIVRGSLEVDWTGNKGDELRKKRKRMKGERTIQERMLGDRKERKEWVRRENSWCSTTEITLISAASPAVQYLGH